MKNVIVIPTYNERENIGVLIPALFKCVPDVYVVVADDSSPDGTGSVVESLRKDFPKLSLITRSTKDGLGRAYINAFSQVLMDTNVRSVVMMDADLSHDPKYLPEMFKKSKDFSVVVGSRYVEGGKTEGWELWRRVLSFWGNFYCRTITRMPVYDCTGGFNVISANLLRKIDFSKMDMSGYAFIMEIKYLLYKADGKFFEVPITFVNRVGGESKISGHIISEGLLAPWKMAFQKSKITPSALLQGEFTRSSYNKYDSLVNSSAPSISSNLTSSHGHVSCPNCEGESAVWGIKNSYTLYSCTNCKLVFVSPLPDPTSVYNQDYFSGAGGGFGYVDYDADKEPMVPTFNKYIDLLGEFGMPKGHLFDIGAATGFFLKIARKRGYVVSGVEMSDHAAGLARRDGIEVKSGDLMSLNLPNKAFEVVTMLDVLEHMTEPFAELVETKRILKPQGLLVVNAPNGQSLLARMLKTKWHLVLPPEHLFYFSPKNLSGYMESHGFKTVYSGTIGKRFTFQYIFKMLYKWQKLSIWNTLSDLFSKGFLSKLYIPINLHDNFFMIFEKHE